MDSVLRMNTTNRTTLSQAFRIKISLLSCPELTNWMASKILNFNAALTRFYTYYEPTSSMHPLIWINVMSCISLRIILTLPLHLPLGHPTYFFSICWLGKSLKSYLPSSTLSTSPIQLKRQYLITLTILGEL